MRMKPDILDRIKSVFYSQKIPVELRKNFLRHLSFINYRHYRIFTIVLLPIFSMLVIWDLFNRRNGLWVAFGYRISFYVHLAVSIFLFLSVIVFYLYPLRTENSINWRHRLIQIFIMIFFVLSLLFMTFAGLQVYGQINAYVIMVFAVGAITLLRYAESAILYTSCLVLLLIELMYLMENQAPVSHHVVNGVILTIMAWVLSRIVYARFLVNYLHEKKIGQQNEDISTMAEKIRTMAEKVRLAAMEYRQLFENIPIGVFRTTMDGRMLAANYALLRTYGFKSLDEINNVGIRNLYAEASGHDRLWELLRAGAVSGFETLFYRADGSIMIVSISGCLLPDDAGNPVFFEGTLEDITERKRTEKALLESEERFRLLAENSADVIFTLNLELRFTYVSPAIVKLRGISTDEAMQQTLEQTLTPASIEIVMAEYERLMSEIKAGKNPTLRMELDLVHRDGPPVKVEISLKTMRDTAGQLSGYIGVARDISERKRAEEQLKLRNAQLAMAANIAQLVHWEIDPARRCFILNDQFYALYNTTAEREGGYMMPIDVFLREFVHPEDVPAIRELMKEIFSRESEIFSQEIDQRIICRGGEMRNHIVRLIVDRDHHGVPVGIYGINQDFTERKRSEQALRESERRLTDIINFLPIATMVINREKKVTAWNQAMEDMTGVRGKDILGKGDYEYALPFYGEKRPILIDLISESEDKLSKDYKHIHHEGGILSAEAFIPKLGRNGVILVAYASVLRNAQGNIVGAIESIRDVTDIRKAEAELKEARNAAEDANRSKSIFLANMSHEIRTPMNAILGFAQLMQRDPNLTGRLREHLSIINRSGEHLLTLINDILEMSKIEAGRSIFVPKTFDLHHLLDDLKLMFRIRTDAKRLQLHVEIVGEVPRWIRTDEGKLRQVLINLMGNSVKFTEEGGIALRVGPLRVPDGEIKLQFEVEDTGPGIAGDEIERLFRAFEQTRTGLKNGGTGLGLALSRGFVQIMGGSLTLTSTVGKGSIFKFVIPVEEAEEEDTETKETKRRVLRLKAGQEEMRVLIADDRETNRQLLLQMLSAVGFRTREAVNGAEVVAVCHEWKPGVILMDMTMPVMDGYEATRQIKSSPDVNKTVIIAVTASAFEEDRQRVLAAGADGYLAKPFKEAVLLEILQKLTGIEYLYEEDTGENRRESIMPAITEQLRTIVASLPADLLRGLRDATMSADIDLMNRLFEQVSQSNPPAAQLMREMAAQYRYEELLNFLS